ncbi:hypothetical protein [Thermoflavimicrobium dichotomicum]|uniref:EthD domain-containing protein n=1 Tax=Thermoflavimicrobium dichotomicum TaxID=46223 RepID=A0A1I3TCT7_9BACL|nr:hypothetical protein [Thermoflavimicrobium dichotomicum]SFJ68944.1 hypothetical protein SAMN05421852_11719 [Thermoflavimicrobium dichotomicum]
MYKTVGIYKGIDDIEAFEKFYVKEVIPRMLKLPGVIKMNITRLYYTNPENQPDGLQDVQFIIETHYESLEAIHKVLDTPEGQELARIITGKNKGRWQEGPFPVSVALGVMERF